MLNVFLVSSKPHKSHMFPFMEKRTRILGELALDIIRSNMSQKDAVFFIILFL